MSSYGLYPDFIDNTEHAPACLGLPTDLFFPEAGDNGADAKAICARCPLKQACRDWALSLTTTQIHGIWGGLNDVDRRRIKREQRAATAATRPRPDECQHCGTYVGNFRRIHMARYHANLAVAA